MAICKVGSVEMSVWQDADLFSPASNQWEVELGNLAFDSFPEALKLMRVVVHLPNWFALGQLCQLAALHPVIGQIAWRYDHAESTVCRHQLHVSI